MKNMWMRFWTFVQHIGWRKIAVGVVGLVVGITLGRVIFKTGVTDAVVQDNTRQVSVASVSDLSNQSSPLSIVGTVNSVSQATVNAESSGAVTAVNHSLGDYVGAGTIVAELENSSQRAAVLQAQGSVDAAQANLDKVQGPSGQSAKTSAVNTLLSAYGAVDSSIRSTADTMISNPDSVTPQFFISTSNSQLPITINNMRATLGGVWTRETSRAKTLSVNDDLTTELATTIDEVRQTRTFFDTILQALNAATPTYNVSQATINADTAASTAARTSLTGALSALAAAQTVLTNGSGTGGADVAAAQAGLKQAQGGLAAARANLEKSIIRAPISGTINSFSLKLGDFVSQNAPVVTIANNGALEIVAYMTQQDVANIVVGNSVDIDGGGKGTITRIAPAIDPVTKKIEVRIGVSDASSLTNGQSVIVNLAHKTTSTPTKTSGRMTIPINAIKVGATETDVFTVTASSTLVAHPVVLGELLGDKVVITQGLTPDMSIVTDARGLRPGETVEVIK